MEQKSEARFLVFDSTDEDPGMKESALRIFEGLQEYAADWAPQNKGAVKHHLANVRPKLVSRNVRFTVEPHKHN